MRIRDEAGQGTVEFILAFLLLGSAIFLTLQLSLLLGYANYIQYATFMAARSYMAAHGSKDEQIRMGEEILLRTVKTGTGTTPEDRFPLIARGTGGGLGGIQVGEGEQLRQAPETENLKWQDGVRYVFSGRVFLLPMGRAKRPDPVTLISESWLGRQPTREECFEEMRRRAGENGEVFFDNGC